MTASAEVRIMQESAADANSQALISTGKTFIALRET
jgi:hypothetical protein